MNGTNGNEPGYPENALVPYPVIVAATRGHRALLSPKRKSNLPLTAPALKQKTLCSSLPLERTTIS